jgi:signal transduction histidine kinase
MKEGAENASRARTESPHVGGDEVRTLLLELHDGPMQVLYAALLQLELLQASLVADGEAAHRAAKVQALLERTSVEMRAILDKDRTKSEESDLLLLLREVAADHQFATRTRVHFLARETLPDPGPVARHALYRVLQESLSNASRHGGAEEIRVRLELSEEDGGQHLTMSVQDDGSGFDPDRVNTKRDTGLAGMADRMRSAGGDLGVHSEPGTGTTVIAAVEVANDPGAAAPPPPTQDPSKPTSVSTRRSNKVVR